MKHGGKEVLVVTRDKHVREKVKEWVSPESRIRWCRGAQDAKEKLTGEDEEAVIIWDASLEDTPKAIRRLHSVRPEARIIVVSPNPRWEEARECFRAGAVDYVSSKMSSWERRRIRERLRQWLV